MNDPTGLKKTSVRQKKDQIREQFEIIQDAN